MKKTLFHAFIAVLLLTLGYTAVGAQDNHPVPAVGDVLEYTGTTQQLNVRSGAGTGNSAIGHLAAGTQITVLEIKNNGSDVWIKHNAAGSEGWSAWLYAGTYTSFKVVTTSAAADAAPAGSVYYYDAAKRVARLIAMNDINSEMQALMRASGMSFTAAQKDARQPEEETLIDVKGESQIVKTGWQTTVTNLVAPFPACFTTDLAVAGDSINYQPDPSNPSKLYTNNVVPFSGTATVYFDCTNWGQLGQAILDKQAAAVVPTVVPASGDAAVAPAGSCYTVAMLQTYGTILKRIQDKNEFAGVQMTFNKPFTPLAGWVLQMNGATVASAKAGDTGTLWAPAKGDTIVSAGCRPILEGAVS